jgi:hypothetical protein
VQTKQYPFQVNNIHQPLKLHGRQIQPALIFGHQSKIFCVLHPVKLGKYPVAACL